MSILDIFTKLAQDEDKFYGESFLGPVLFGGIIHVRINGVILKFRVKPSSFTGWGVFRTTKHNVCKLIHTASRLEIAKYLDLLTQVRLIVCSQEDPHGIFVNGNNFHTSEMVPIRLIPEEEGLLLFDTVITGYDGYNFLYSSIDIRMSMRAAYLRESLNSNIKPNELSIDGLTKNEKIAYALVYKIRETQKLEQLKLTTEYKLKSAVERAGGNFIGYNERSDAISVEFYVDGQKHLSTINKNLGVISAGICLNGTDKQYDLQSLVTVIREGQNRGLIYRVGQNRDYDDDIY